MQSLTDSVGRGRRLAELFVELHELTRRGDHDGVMARVEEAVTTMGLDRLDLVLGIVQPLLYEIGEAWEQGRIDPSVEHVASSLAERLVDQLRGQPTPVPEASQRPEVIVTSLAGNKHGIGVKLLDLALQRRGVRTLLQVGATPDELLASIRANEPRLVALSAAVLDQLPVVRGLVEAMRAEGLLARTELHLGGASPRRFPEDWAALGVVVAAPDTLAAIEAMVRHLRGTA